jgi:hypothetical protein
MMNLNLLTFRLFERVFLIHRVENIHDLVTDQVLLTVVLCPAFRIHLLVHLRLTLRRNPFWTELRGYGIRRRTVTVVDVAHIDPCWLALGSSTTNWAEIRSCLLLGQVRTITFFLVQRRVALDTHLHLLRHLLLALSISALHDLLLMWCRTISIDLLSTDNHPRVVDRGSLNLLRLLGPDLNLARKYTFKPLHEPAIDRFIVRNLH